MTLAKDLIGVGQPAEQAIREGFTTIFIQSVATIGGPTGANLIEAGSASSYTFLNTTEPGKQYFLMATGTTLTVYVPTSAGSGNTSLFQDAVSSFSLTSGKSAAVIRLGINGTVNTTTDRWMYVKTG